MATHSYTTLAVELPPIPILSLQLYTPGSINTRIQEIQGILDTGSPQELESLMQIYNEGWLRKTAGLVEAVKRGLMEPLG
jgi:hypothetical protein